MAENIIAIKGNDIRLLDIFAGRVVVYRHPSGNAICVRYQDGGHDYFIKTADVLVQRPAALPVARREA